MLNRGWGALEVKACEERGPNVTAGGWVSRGERAEDAASADDMTQCGTTFLVLVFSATFHAFTLKRERLLL